MADINHMYTNMLNVLKGWPVGAVDKTAAAASGVSIVAGQVAHLNAAGELALGVAGTDMALFIITGTGEPDVQLDSYDSFQGVYGGNTTGLVACYGYELETTEYVDADYAPNDVLTAATTGANAGNLVAGTEYTDPICGVVSDGTSSNANGISVLRFWTVWLPPVPD